MVNAVKLAKYIKKKGWKQFNEEFKQKREEQMLEPKTLLRMQTQGYTGTLLFSLITIPIFAYQGLWTLSGIFLFNSLIMFAQLQGVRNQLNNFKSMEELQKQMVEEEKKNESSGVL